MEYTCRQAESVGDSSVIEPKLLQQLRSLIGRRIEYRGYACVVIEILDTEKALVIRCEDRQPVIQGNQFGDATRRVQQSHTLSLFDDNDHLNMLIRGWLNHD